MWIFTKKKDEISPSKTPFNERKVLVTLEADLSVYRVTYWRDNDLVKLFLNSESCSDTECVLLNFRMPLFNEVVDSALVGKSSLIRREKKTQYVNFQLSSQRRISISTLNRS